MVCWKIVIALGRGSITSDQLPSSIIQHSQCFVIFEMMAYFNAVFGLFSFINFLLYLTELG